MTGKRSYGSGGAGLLALLGLGLFSGVKSITDHAQKRKIEHVEAIRQAEFEAKKADYNSLEGYLYDEKAEYYKKKYLDSHYWDLEMAQIVDPFVKGIMIDDVEADMSFFRRHQKDTTKLLFILLMSKEGFVPKTVATSGFQSPMIYDYERKLMWNFTHEVMKRVDKELQKHGKEKMLFKSNSEPRGIPGVPIETITTPTFGWYYWNSGRLMRE